METVMTNLCFKLVLDALRLCQLAAELLLVSRLQLQLCRQIGSTGLSGVQLACSVELLAVSLPFSKKLDMFRTSSVLYFVLFRLSLSQQLTLHSAFGVATSCDSV